MQARELLGVLGRQRQAGLVARDRLVLGSVVLEDALQVLHSRDQPQVADEDRDPEDLLDDHEHQTGVQLIAEQVRQYMADMGFRWRSAWSGLGLKPT